MPLNTSIRKVLVIGSGPIVIGQAAEFDYAGAQACRVLKAAGLDVVLVNSNPATIMTDKALADEIYLEPLTEETVMRIIEKERPDSLLANLGGQIGLTIAMQLDKSGFLKRMGVRLLGTSAEAIDRAEDRELFKETMEKIGQPCVPSDIATDLDHACQIAERIGLPVIIRPAFTMGGAGGGVAYDMEQFRTIAANGLLLSPISQILVEKFIGGWKEIEFEVMRDAAGNAIAICSMENVDPVGVHTGDSIVVAPAFTLAAREYMMLRNAAIDIIQELKIEGGCNCQFALDPESFEYAVIEVNPRVSRSSALASKATGFPIAKVTSKIALGYTLDEIPNDVTGVTCACFEPAVDYCVVKLPKWPFDKFVGAKRTLGTQMKATGEVMSIAPSFEMAIMKAVRGAEIGLDTLNMPSLEGEDPVAALSRQDDRRLFAIYRALKLGVSVEEVHRITMVDEWFLEKLKGLADFEASIADKQLDEETYREGKRLGYPDKALERLSGHPVPFHQPAVYKMVDTCAAEHAARTPYFYSTADEVCEARTAPRSGKPRIVVLGSGPIRIGQGIEFDYSSVHCVWTLQKLGYEVVIINNNPETVSTDFDTADRLYFEPLTAEDVLNVLEVEKPEAVVVAFGGQTAIKLTKTLDEKGFTLLGTSAEGIDTAEDREKFDALLEKYGFKRPRGHSAMTMEDALAAAQDLGYPVLLRPSYVIGGQNMTIARCDEDVRRYMTLILAQGIENPVLIDQYLMGSELEVDVISDGTDVLIPGVMQHIERAGVHSGDSIAVYPPYNLSDQMLHKLVECSEKLALSLGTKGLVNIQYLTWHNELYVIEVNPRASRTIPYISKVTGVPMVDIAARVMTGTPLKTLGYGTGLYKVPPYIAVKVPVFSFEKLNDVDSTLGPEMKSTGEVLGLGKTMEEALFKGLVSAGFKVEPPRDAGIYITVNDADKSEILPLAKKFADLGMHIYATRGTAAAIESMDIPVTTVARLSENDGGLDMLEQGLINYVIYTGVNTRQSVEDYTRFHRRAVQLGVTCLTSLDTASALADILISRFNQYNTELVDINRLRTERQKLRFVKMVTAGNDYIYLDNFDGAITCPESLCLKLCRRHNGVGCDGLVLIERSKTADAKMRIFNKDGSEGRMAGNSILCVAKYLYDNQIVPRETLSIETASGTKQLTLYPFGGRARTVTVDLGPVEWEPASVPVKLNGRRVVNRPVEIGGQRWNITCLALGNPHCVVFVPHVDEADVKQVGPLFEHDPLFPQRVNTEFVRVVNPNMLKMRVWERGNGETLACGTGACAAVAAACEQGLCRMGENVTVKLRGGDLTVNYTPERVLLTGTAEQVFEGVTEY